MSTELEAFESGLMVGAICGWVATYHPNKIQAVRDALLEMQGYSFDAVRAVIEKTTGDRFNDAQLYGLYSHLKAAGEAAA